MKRLLILIFLLAAAGAAAQTLAPQRFVWTRPVTGEPAVSYQVQTRENGGAWSTAATVDDTFHVFTDLSALSTWEVRVAGIDALGRRGAWSPPSLPLQSDLGPPGVPGTPVLQEP
jgi:hypothetical protein